MSDHYLRLVAQPPGHVPSAAQQAAAVAAVKTALPDAEMVEVLVSPTITFIDCGENFEAVICPACQKRSAFDPYSESDSVGAWFQAMFEDVELVDDHYLDIRDDSEVAMPCCDAKAPILAIEFDWPQAFGRVELSVMNPDAATLPDGLLAEVRAALGCEVAVVWARY